MDIVSPLPIAATQNKFLLVTIDYFNKWVEVEVYASIKDKDVTKTYIQCLVIHKATDKRRQQTKPIECTEEKVGGRKRKMSGRTARGLIGLSNNIQMANRNHSFCPCLWYEDKMRGVVTIRIASYHQRAIAQYNKKARPWFFRSGTLVLRRIFENTIEIGAGKLQANWEGSYVVTKVGDSWTYHLQTLDDEPLLCPWNVVNLKQYYQ
ncbi:hypothetical protein CK203_097413 [Vitis vinifera]|uniref:Integrase catalytic domain-containing protein n=1 Tax=Vitis vinifera TaxID=29760 RepID=A0A438D9B8_VITVI|nr:hypothetical protein CK203_097413 [Vitis vinifera]